MKRLSNKLIGNFKKLKSPSLTITNTRGSSPEPVTSASTIIPSAADPMRSVASAATGTIQVFQATDFANAQASSSVVALAAINDPQAAPMALEDLRNKSPSPDTIIQTDVGSVDSERNPLTQHSGSSFFAGAQNIVVTGGTFNNLNLFPANTGEGRDWKDGRPRSV